MPRAIVFAVLICLCSCATANKQTAATPANRTGSNTSAASIQRGRRADSLVAGTRVEVHLRVQQDMVLTRPPTVDTIRVREVGIIRGGFIREEHDTVWMTTSDIRSARGWDSYGKSRQPLAVVARSQVVSIKPIPPRASALVFLLEVALIFMVAIVLSIKLLFGHESS